jgi:uncharacterized membrane protein
MKVIALAILSVGIYIGAEYGYSIHPTGNFTIEMCITLLAAIMVLFYKEKS